MRNEAEEEGIHGVGLLAEVWGRKVMKGGNWGDMSQ